MNEKDIIFLKNISPEKDITLDFFETYFLDKPPLFKLDLTKNEIEILKNEDLYKFIEGKNKFFKGFIYITPAGYVHVIKKIKDPKQIETISKKENLKIQSNKILLKLKLMDKDFTYDTKARFNINEEFVLPQGSLFDNKKIKTTVGRYIVNKFLLTPNIGNFIGYINKPFDKDAIGDLNNKIVKLFYEDKITSNDMNIYIDRYNWLGLACSMYFASSVTMDILKPIPEVMKRKKELIKKYEEGIKKGDILSVNKISKELEDLAWDILDKKGKLDIYKSGASKAFGNTYKNTSIMRGGIKDMDKPGEYHICLDNLYEGIEKENRYKYCDLSIDASYSRGVKTQDGGYLFKKFSSAFQSVTLDPNKNSNCGTKETIEIYITKKNIKFLKFRYIVEGKKLILLDDKNINEYIGKKVKMRSPLFCLNDQICSKCAGLLYHELEIENIGLATGKIASNLMLQSMKSFHNSNIETNKINIFDKIKKI